MIKNIFLLLILGTLVWNDKVGYYHIIIQDTSVASAQRIVATQSRYHTAKKTFENQSVYRDKSHTSSRTKKRSKIAILLQKNKFLEALTLYREIPTANNLDEIKKYFIRLGQQNPLLAIEYMQLFLDNISKKSVATLMIKTLMTEKKYAKAIDHIIALKEYPDISEQETEKLDQDIEDVSLLYIEVLLKKESYQTLIQFLESMITYDSNNSFYPFQLAKVYLKINKFDEAKALLETLVYDEEYQLRVEALLSDIEKEDTSNTYEYTIPLITKERHHLVDVFIEGEPLRLMIDTGASYIYIDEDKATSLEVLKDIQLQTAGEEVEAKLCVASTMQVGSVELHNMKVTVAPFKREGIDGLLGMNFLNKFDFIIDQKNNKLYLNKK